jgi:hypothetical protein
MTQVPVMSEAEFRVRVAALYRRFPYQFSRYHPPSFSHGPGWLHIIEVTCLGVDRALGDKAAKKSFWWTQFYEKYGALRMDYGGHSLAQAKIVAIDDVILKAEDASLATCDTCGRPGALRENRAWIVTRCDAHV